MGRRWSSTTWVLHAWIRCWRRVSTALFLASPSGVAATSCCRTTGMRFGTAASRFVSSANDNGLARRVMSRDESTVDRRDFLKTASAAGIGLAMSSHVSPLVAQGRSPNETVRVAVAGLNSRGLTHVQDVIKSPNAQLAYLCDVDSQVLAKAGDIAAKAGDTGVQRIADFRRALDDKDVDALFIAMPDHWHTPAAIMALQAGKHVYVEKPG